MSRDVKVGRTCVSCRCKDSAAALLRVTGNEEVGLVVDWKRNLGGRGAHVCLSHQCIDKAISHRLFDRVLRCKPMYPSTHEMEEVIHGALDRKLAALISSSVGSRKIAIGSDACEQAMRSEEVYFLLVATDMSSRQRFVEMAQKGNIPVQMLPNKEMLGDTLGRRATGVAGVTDRKIAGAIGVLFDQRKELLRTETPV